MTLHPFELHTRDFHDQLGQVWHLLLLDEFAYKVMLIELFIFAIVLDDHGEDGAPGIEEVQSALRVDHAPKQRQFLNIAELLNFLYHLFE